MTFIILTFTISTLRIVFELVAKEISLRIEQNTCVLIYP